VNRLFVGLSLESHKVAWTNITQGMILFI